jgi:catechol 2,3-dioxygenase-like lactoylglutathione lyase family enzyme
MSDRRGRVTRFVHTGIVVEDLPRMVEFFTALGLDCGKAFTVQGPWLDRILNLPDARVEVVMVSLPDGTDTLEIVKFHAPAGGEGPAAEPAPANRLGIRHVAYLVEELDAVLERMARAGWGPVGEVIDYEGQFLLVYLRGPEGLIVELAQNLPRP